MATTDPRTNRPGRPARRLTLLDVMILVASTALGLAGARSFYPSMDPPATGRLAWAFAGPLTVLVVSWSLALLGLRALPPRPTRRRVVRQPGWVACASAVAGTLLGLASRAAFNAAHSGPMEGLWALSILWSEGVRLTPAFVCGAWAWLRLTGRWSGGKELGRPGRPTFGGLLARLARPRTPPAHLVLFLPQALNPGGDDGEG